MKQRILNVLFWSILSAAFLGPGTVTTAASAGAEFGFALLWALVFSTVACVVLQEASARLTLATGHNLGASIRRYVGEGRAGWMLTGTVVGAIVLGCAAYETGNILGAVAGVALIFDVSPAACTLMLGGAAAALLGFGSTRRVAQVLGGVVAVMGVCFLTTAVLVGPSIVELLAGGLVPRVPAGAELLILALVGTTVVPYNLFLGSGLAHHQSLGEMRWSLALAIGLGGVISVGVLVVGTALAGTFTFEALAAELAARLGGWAAHLLGVGLFAAGFSSTITASLAAAVTVRSVVPGGREAAAWRSDGVRYRMVWASVLVVGVGFGVAEVQPVPAIILAQALNGVILPVVAVYLLLVVNDARALSPKTINSGWYNGLMGLVVFLTLVLGLTNLLKALNRVLAASLIDPQIVLLVAVGLALCAAWPIVRRIQRLRRPADPASAVSNPR